MLSMLYADDAVLVVAASTLQELTDALRQDFNLVSNWYTDNKSTVDVKKTKLMPLGSKTMWLIKGQANRVSFFFLQTHNYLQCT